MNLHIVVVLFLGKLPEVEGGEIQLMKGKSLGFSSSK